MGSPFLSGHKSLLSIFMMLLIFVVEQTQGVCIEDERKALLEIKASLHESSYRGDVNNLLSTWVDHEITHGKCCDWERIKCDTTGHITDLSLSNVFNMFFREYGSESDFDLRWSLNFSSFLRFKELKSLDLSCNFIDDTIVNTGLVRLPTLSKLEILNLSTNNIEANIFPLLRGHTSLKTLDLSYFNGYQFTPTYDISEFSVAENLEELHLTCCGYYGTLQIQALSNFTNLKTLDLSCNNLDIIPSIQGCKSLTRLERLESVSLGDNNFNKSVISCLSFLPSLKILDLSYSSTLGTDFPMQELSTLRELKTLDLSFSRLTSFALNGTMSNLVHLNLNSNFFDDGIMRFMAAFPSLRYLSMENGAVGGRLFTNEVPTMPYLEVLLLRRNAFNGSLPMEGSDRIGSSRAIDSDTTIDFRDH